MLKDDPLDICRVWKDKIELSDVFAWCFVVGIPIVFGPILTFLLKLDFHLAERVSGESSIDTSTRPQQRYIVATISLLIITSNSIHLLIAEKYLTPSFSLDLFTSLLLKYFFGSLELVLAPFIICLMDNEIKQGIRFLYRRKRKRPGTGNLR